MGRDERYDVVIIGGGPNGMTAAAYVAKCGLQVCVLEERVECGGACETVEPVPGVRIYPHAMLMYASPAPGFDQLELVEPRGRRGIHEHGMRVDADPWYRLDGLARASALHSLFQHTDLKAALGHVGGRSHAVGPAADDHHIVSLVSAHSLLLPCVRSRIARRLCSLGADCPNHKADNRG